MTLFIAACGGLTRSSGSEKGRESTYLKDLLSLVVEVVA